MVVDALTGFPLCYRLFVDASVQIVLKKSAGAHFTPPLQKKRLGNCQDVFSTKSVLRTDETDFIGEIYLRWVRGRI